MPVQEPFLPEPPLAPHAAQRTFRSWATVLLLLALFAVLLTLAPRLSSRPSSGLQLTGDAAVLDGYRKVEVASVSDAIEKVLGKRMYMSHRMRPLFPTKFAGYALTVQLKQDEGNTDPNALGGMLAAIDQGAPDSVYVMVVENGENIAGMGGLMGTAMHARDFSGAVIDGGARDVAYLQKIGFPVYSTGVVPSTSIGHYKFGGANIPVVCDGVTVRPGDIVTADADGVVVVPREKAAEVLTVAADMDFKEHSMYAWIEKLKSIEEAVKKFGRL